MKYKVEPKKVIFFHAITPVHMGAGQGLDHIDLPIQREQHTKFPIFYASGIKGALRHQALEIAKEECGEDIRLTELDESVEQYNCNKNADKSEENQEQKCKEQVEILAKIFGSQNCKGKLTVSDAKILFFPVKSLKGVFAYVTCPYVLNRYGEDTGKEKIFDSEIPEGKILASETLKVDDNENKVVLEEFEFENGKDKAVNEIIKKLNLPEELKNKISQRVAIVSDDIFSYFAENLTEVVNRIKVNPETGTVKEGGLWTEEYLPAESVLYSLWFESEDLSGNEERYLPSNGSLLILGGDQTVGKGIVKLYERGFKNENS